ncbi:MAG: DNA repair protein RecN, partial [Clostridia bacterium]|nr:DNA repair protein RecN [Clostridia bacterium]
TVLTGETGAGKSVILDCIGILLGQRVSRELIRSGESKASVSGLFCGLSADTVAALDALGVSPDEEGGILLQKSFTADGRSQIKLNGQSITLALQREIARLLICINGQHEGHALLQKASHLTLLDAYGDHSAALAEYRTAYDALIAARSALNALQMDAAEKARRVEMLTYQVKDIDSVKPRVGEEEKLTAEAAKLQNLEKISRHVDLAAKVLIHSEKSAAVLQLERAAAALRQIEDVVPEAAGLVERLKNCRYEVEDIGEQIAGYEIDCDGDPTARLNRIEGRLDAISRLKRKYGNDEEEILAFRARAAAELETLLDADERADLLRGVLNECRQKATDAARVLHQLRLETAETIREKIRQTLVYLDMPGVRFGVSVELQKGTDGLMFRADGADDVEFLLSANPGEPLLPMAKIASGGELSRVLLALKRVLADRDGVGTIVFDEIDTGISGKTARKIGHLLSDISADTQVICVTHSAQVASMADEHCLIAKHVADGRTESRVRILSEQERIEEIARILGGIQITARQMEAAEELLRDRGTLPVVAEDEVES